MSTRVSKNYDWTPQVGETQKHIEELLKSYNPSGGLFWEFLTNELFTLAETVAEQIRNDWFADTIEQGDQAFKLLNENFLVALQAVKDGVIVHPKREKEEDV